MLKTPVSLLQELTVQKKIGIPDYQCHGTGEAHCMSFTCHVKVGSQTAVGTGSTKKDARHDAAKNMLNILGMDVENAPQAAYLPVVSARSHKSEGPQVNYIGKLNEFASSHRYSQPTYNDHLSLSSNGQFHIACCFKSHQTDGYGLNKKDAKQDSARKMVELIKSLGDEIHISLEPEENVNNNKLEVDKEIRDKVLMKYTDLLKNFHLDEDSKPNNSIESAETNLEINFTNWEEMINYLDRCGHTHKLTTFQSNPMILSLKINDHVFMHFGKSRQEILDKFVFTVIDRLIKGVDFSKPLFE